jgi:diguanylate cyclase (GGDEF)-like protein
MTKIKTEAASRVPDVPAERLGKNAILAVSILLALVLAAALSFTIYNNSRLGAILEDSVKSELLAVCFAARGDIDIDLFMSIDNEADFFAHETEINQCIEKLRDLKNGVGATYIYVLKEIDGKFFFIFDTDEEAGTPDNPIFTEYELAETHLSAFAGESATDIMNVEDEWGSYNTGAIPLYDGETIVGIVSVDFEDTYIERSKQAALVDAILLIATMAVTMAVLLGILIMLLRRNQSMQKNLSRVANHDAITGLYNRYYLFSYLSTWSKLRHSATASFGLLFIDLDNFKSVNDNAGHDDGDELLRLISQFFDQYTQKDKSDGCIESMTARIGGDEFLQIISDVATAEELQERAHAMLKDFALQPDLQSFIEEFGVGLSIGGALFPSQTNDYSELIKLADIAMYQAKAQGKNRYFLYDEALGDGPEGVTLSIRTGPRTKRTRK